jgi:CheY-like chemotaxis protein
MRYRISMPGFVLVVDDNEAHCYAMKKMLERAHYDVATAHTGSEAFAIASGLLPDIVLLDINLPDMNGVEVCRRIRSHSKTSHLPVIFHSATHATDEWRQRAESVGATDFLTYPIEPAHLLMVIEGALAGGRNRRKKTG